MSMHVVVMMQTSKAPGPNGCRTHGGAVNVPRNWLGITSGQRLQDARPG